MTFGGGRHALASNPTSWRAAGRGFGALPGSKVIASFGKNVPQKQNLAKIFARAWSPLLAFAAKLPYHS